MFYIIFIILLFIASAGTHIFFCRKTTKPGLQAKAFGLIAIVALGIYVLAAGTPLMASVLDPHSLWGMPFKITAGVIFVLLVPVYLCFYVLTQLTSPSGKILRTIVQRKEVSRADILACVKEEDFITSRLNDLCAGGCVTQVDGRYVLTSEGRKIAEVLKVMQLLLGREAGG